MGNPVKDILEPIDKICSKLFGDEVAGKITITIFSLVALSAVIVWLRNVVNYFVLRRNQKVLNRDLQPYFSSTDVIRATQYYILPKYQNVAPSEDEELGTQYIASAKEKLLPLFLNNVFRKGKLDEKFFLILADTGMGKTSFMINLYIKYKNRKANKFYSPFQYNIKLMPLGYAGALEKITAIQDKENTILLLDAFDEDINALDRHEERMREIIDVVKEFRFIVITCRTQFFPSEKEEPERTKYLTFGDSGKEYKFQKVYLSVFTDRDITKYLIKRFGFPFTLKFRRAKLIAQRSPNLVVRPLLLSYINDLLTSQTQYDYTIDIYSALIGKWIEREAKKPGMQQKYGSVDRYRTILYNFSKKLAADLYDNRTKRGGYFIDKYESIPDCLEMQLSDIEEDYKLTDAEKRSKSLLNRNSAGKYKFSHKSILEFFLAQILFERDLHSYSQFDFDGMSNVSKFYDEFGISYLTSKSKLDAIFVHVNRLEQGLITRFVSSFNDKFRTLKMFHDQPIEQRRNCEWIHVSLLKDEIFRYASLIPLKNLKSASLWTVDIDVLECLCAMNYIKVLLGNQYGFAKEVVQLNRKELGNSIRGESDDSEYYLLFGRENDPHFIKFSHMLFSATGFKIFDRAKIAEHVANADDFRLMERFIGVISEQKEVTSFLRKPVSNNVSFGVSYTAKTHLIVKEEIIGRENDLLYSPLLIGESVEVNFLRWLTVAALESDVEVFIDILKRANDFLAEVSVLETMLPNCDFSFNPRNNRNN